MNRHMRQLIKMFVNLGLCGVMTVSLPLGVSGSSLSIRHSPPTCVASSSPFGIAADIDSAVSIQDARIYFKVQESPSYYFVQMHHQDGSTYTGMLPAPKEDGIIVEYRLLAVDQNEEIAKSPIFYTLTYPASKCESVQEAELSVPIIVYVEQEMPPEQGFSGENVEWKYSGSTEPAYFSGPLSLLSVDETDGGDLETARQSKGFGLPDESGESEGSEEETSSAFSLQGINTTTMLGVGAGVGAAVVIGIIATRQEDQGIQWQIEIDNKASGVDVEIIKIPDMQTSCGTFVTNQLYVTNNGAETLTVNSIEYEIVLTKDNPGGSCDAGRIGTFAPNWATIVGPGERALVREWSNEVNPCSGCPYLTATCEWTSKYIIHTSVGDAEAETKFTVQGDLCGRNSFKKTFGSGNQLKGDIEP